MSLMNGFLLDDDSVDEIRACYNMHNANSMTTHPLM
jgi:hypothetical protein